MDYSVICTMPLMDYVYSCNIRIYFVLKPECFKCIIHNYFVLLITNLSLFYPVRMFICYSVKILYPYTAHRF